LGEFVGFKSGHTENHALRSALLAQPEAWDIVTFTDQRQAGGAYTQLGGWDYAS
jgi:UDP-3-O-[3-hydroxymyristoyl] N-acetylglucosamine deacetylase